MEIVKKIIGVLLMAIAVLLSIGILFTLPNSIGHCISKFKEPGVYGFAYLAGTLVGDAIFILITVFCFKKGLKLIRSKIEPHNEINEIGL